jgi:transketolase
MAAIGNGMAAYGALIPYTATFLVFITYAFPAVRMAAIAGHRQIFVMTHDSIGLGTTPLTFRHDISPSNLSLLSAIYFVRL